MPEEMKAAGERLLVYIGTGPGAANVIHAAKRMAATSGAKWYALSVESPDMPLLSQEELNSITDNLRLAERLGAEASTVRGRNVAEEILKFAGERKITRIIVGMPRRPLWKSIFSREPVDQLVRMISNIDVCFVAGEPGEPAETAYVVRPKTTPLSDYAGGFLFLILATVVCFFMYPYFDLSNLIMVYLLGVMLTAMNCGRGPAMLTSLLSVLTFDFFFVPPRFSFTVDEAQYIVTFLVMFFVALVISHLTALMRQQTEIARMQERQAAAMHGLSRQLASARGVNSILGVAVLYLAQIFDCQVAALLPDEAGKFKLHPAVGDLSSVIEKDIVKEMTIARSAYETGQMAGWGTQTPQTTKILYVPLQAADSTLGVLALRATDTERFLLPEQLNLLESLAKQVALALEVEHLTGQGT